MKRTLGTREEDNDNEEERDEEEEEDVDTDKHEDADSEDAEVKEDEDEEEEIDENQDSYKEETEIENKLTTQHPPPEFKYTPDLTTSSPSSSLPPSSPGPGLGILCCPSLHSNSFANSSSRSLFDGFAYSDYGAHWDSVIILKEQHYQNKKDMHMANYTLGFDLFRIMGLLVPTRHFSKKRRYVTPAIVSQYIYSYQRVWVEAT
jgi:hypothetical protein